MEFGHRLGCHQMPQRSFFYHGYQFPVCARCTGVIIASVIATIVFFLFPIKIWLAFVMSFIMFMDWYIQYLNIKQSNNIRRLITGLIGGYGFMTLQMYLYKTIIIYVFKLIDYI